MSALIHPATGSKRPHEDADDESDIDEDKLLGNGSGEIDDKELENLTSQIDDVVLSDEEEGETSTPRTKRGLELREYQKELASVAVQGENTVIYAATGAGKTRVAFYVVKEHLEKNPTGKVALMADKTYLVKQHEFALKAFLPEYEKSTLRVSGEQENSTNIHLLLDKYSIFILTPALIENTMKRHDPEFLCKFSLLIFDECHHTKGRSTYNRLMVRYHMLKNDGKPLPQIVGLTATFGTNKANTVEKAAEHLLTVMANLDVIEISSVSKNSEEYEKFRNDVKTAKHVLPDVNENDRVYKSVVNAMKLTEDVVCSTSDKIDRINPDKEEKELITVLNRRNTSKRGEEAYITWIGDLENSAAALYGKRGEIATVVSMGAKYLKVYSEVLEINYQLTSSCAAKALVQKLVDAGFGKSSTSTEEVEKNFATIAQDLETELTNMPTERTNMPKYRHDMDEKPIDMLLKILNEKKSTNPRFIVMVQKREIAGMLTQLLKEEGYRVETFTGSSANVDVGGTSKSEQESAVKQFRDGKIEGLVATNILEEGLDIPECNLMIPYLYVGNEISTRQTAGRIRATKGEKILLSDAKKHLRESLNVQRGALMDEAMKIVLGMTRDKRQEFISNEQKAIIRKEQQRMQQENNAAKKVKLDNSKYKMVCAKCSNFSVNCSSLRCINEQHHAIIDPAIWAQVTTKPFPKQVPKFDKDLNCQGRLFGSGINKCTHELGTVSKFREVPLPFLSYKMVRVIDTDTGKSFKLGKWSDAPFSIAAIVEPDDLDVMAAVSPNLIDQKPTT